MKITGKSKYGNYISLSKSDIENAIVLHVQKIYPKEHVTKVDLFEQFSSGREKFKGKLKAEVTTKANNG